MLRFLLVPLSGLLLLGGLPLLVQPASALDFCDKHHNASLPECQRRYRRSTDKLLGKSKTRKGYCRYVDRRRNVYETRCRKR